MYTYLSTYIFKTKLTNLHVFYTYAAFVDNFGNHFTSSINSTKLRRYDDALVSSRIPCAACPSRANGAASHLSLQSSLLRILHVRPRQIPKRNECRSDQNNMSTRYANSKWGQNSGDDQPPPPPPSRRCGPFESWATLARLCQSRHSREQVQLQLLPTPQ